MKKIIFIFLGFLSLIIVLAVIALWRMPNLADLESVQNVLPEDFKETFPSLTKENKPQEFVSSDGEFKIEYPGNWFAVNQEGLLKSLAPEEWTEKYGLQTLFLAQNLFGGKLAQMIVYKGTFAMPAEEIFEEMKAASGKQGWKVETVESDIKDNEGIFESKYFSTAGAELYTKEKILIKEKDAYIISAITLKKDWLSLKSDIDKIIDSAIIVRVGKN